MDGTNLDGNQKIPFCIAGGAAVADWDGQMWTSDGNYDLMEAAESHAVAGAAANIRVQKLASGVAKGAGVNMLASAGFSAAASANVPRFLGPTTTQADRRIARGDRVSIDVSGASAALDGVSVTVFLRAIPDKNAPAS